MIGVLDESMLDEKVPREERCPKRRAGDERKRKRGVLNFLKKFSKKLTKEPNCKKFTNLLKPFIAKNS